jgi:hypothetical protein
MRAIGFHGTSVERAERILAHGFEASRNDYDWLGDGAYFFQDALGRAREWAQRFGSQAAVIGAEIDLDDCLDLLTRGGTAWCARRTLPCWNPLARKDTRSRGRRAERTGWIVS